jgi:hypothetical protein
MSSNPKTKEQILNVKNTIKDIQSFLDNKDKNNEFGYRNKIINIKLCLKNDNEEENKSKNESTSMDIV